MFSIDQNHLALVPQIWDTMKVAKMLVSGGYVSGIYQQYGTTIPVVWWHQKHFPFRNLHQHL